MSALENEATDTAPTFDHFGRTWTLPSSLRLSHMRKLRAHPDNIGIVDALLDDAQLAALDEVDPTDKQLDEFTDLIAEAMGVKDSGNS